MALTHLRAGRSTSRVLPSERASLRQLLLGTHYRSTRVVVLLMALAVMSFFDLVLTMTYLTNTGLLESNPVARLLIESGGHASVVLWKVLTVALSVFIFYVARKRLSGELGAVLCCAVLAWLMVRWHTYTDEAHTITGFINQPDSMSGYDWVSLNPDAEPSRSPARPTRVVLRSDPWDEP